MAQMTQVLSRRGGRTGALLVGVGTAAGLIAWGVAPWLAPLAGITPVLLASRVRFPACFRWFCFGAEADAGGARETTARLLADVSRLRATGPRSGHQMMK